MRFVRLRTSLNEIAKAFDIQMVAYEEVARHRGTAAAHVYGGIRAVITAWAEDKDPKIPYVGIPVGTIKKKATGKGNAGKQPVIDAVRREPPDCLTEQELDKLSDNVADAIWIARCARDDHMEGLA